MNHIRRTIAVALTATAALFTVVSTAAADAPGVKTGNATAIESGAVTLAANVDPNNEATTYYFEYGTTRRYGSRTADASAGRGANSRRVTVRVQGLAANTEYHYRVVASNRSGVRSGADRTFKTKRQPLGLQISAAPNPVSFGSASTIVGALTGTGSAGRQVVLQQRGFPFTSDFVDVGNAVVTDAAGAFSFPVLPLTGTTQFRVRTVAPDDVFSEALTLAVSARIGTKVSDRSVRRYKRVRFRGLVTPARVGAPFEIQRETGTGRWLVVGRGFTTARGDTSSRYSKSVRVTRTAKYRVLVHMLDGAVVSGFGREVGVAVKKKS